MLTEFVILSLAVWRLSNLIVNEDGPLDIFGRLRDWAGVQYDSLGNPYGEGQLAKLMSCIYCTSVWVALVLTLTIYYQPLFWLLCGGLAASTVAVVISEKL